MSDTGVSQLNYDVLYATTLGCSVTTLAITTNNLNADINKQIRQSKQLIPANFYHFVQLNVAFLRVLPPLSVMNMYDNCNRCRTKDNAYISAKECHFRQCQNYQVVIVGAVHLLSSAFFELYPVNSSREVLQQCVHLPTYFPES